MPDTMMPSPDMLLPSPLMSSEELAVRAENCRLAAANFALMKIIAELDAQRVPFDPKDPTFDPRYGDQCDDGPIDPPATKAGVFPTRALGFHSQRIGLYVPR